MSGEKCRALRVKPIDMTGNIRPSVSLQVQAKDVVGHEDVAKAGQSPGSRP